MTFTYHFHVNDEDGHPENRTVSYHDHPGSFLFDLQGNIIHDHRTDPPTYIKEGR